MVLLTFNIKGIEELIGNPPILLDVPDERLFKDVLLNVVEKLNPLMPDGKKLSLEALSIESYDGEPLSLVTYSKHVADVIIDFGTSFVVSPKGAARDAPIDEVVKGKSSLEVIDITNEILKAEGAPGTQSPTGGGLPAHPSPGIASGPPPASSALTRATPATPGPMKMEARLPRSREADLVEREEEPVAAPLPSPPALGEEAPAPPPSTTEVEKKQLAADKGRKKAGALEKATGKMEQPSEMGEADVTSDEMEADLRPEPKSEYDKSISVDYFDVMNPENYYPVVVDIADIEQAWKPVQENVITGERVVQVKEKAVFETDTVLVRPVFPGCTVAPAELEADLKKPKDVLTFYVTPLVRGGIKGELHFLANGKIVHKTELPASVQDPRYGRMIMLYGLIASMVPKFSALFSIDLGGIINDALGISLGSDVLTSIIAIAGTGIAAMIGLIYYASHRPKNAKLKLHVSDFRMTIVPPNVP